MTPDFVVNPVGVVLAVVAICLIYFAQRTPRRLPGGPPAELLLRAGMARLKTGDAIIYPQSLFIVYPQSFFDDGYLLQESEIDPYLEWICKRREWFFKVFLWEFLTLSIILAIFDLRSVDFLVLLIVWLHLSIAIDRIFVNKDFGARFPNAKKTKDPNRRRRWFLATLAQRDFPRWYYFVMAVGLFAGPILVGDLNHLRMPPMVSWFDWGKHLLFIVYLWLGAAFFGYLVVKEVMFRRRHGRPPDQKDVEALG